MYDMIIYFKFYSFKSNIMKKFTLLATGILFCSMAFSQTATFTRIWDKSLMGEGTYNPDEDEFEPSSTYSADYIGNGTERGMAFFDGKLYIPSRNGNNLQVVDAQTGVLSEKIGLPADVFSGGTFVINDIAITSEGNILIANLAGGEASPFKVYLGALQDDGSYVWSLVVEYKTGDHTNPLTGSPFVGTRLGDGIGVYGDISATGDGYIITGDAASRFVFRFDIYSGVKTTEATIIELKDAYPVPSTSTFTILGVSPRFFPISDDLFYMDSHIYFPSLYDMQGELQDKFSGVAKPLTQGICGVYSFNFKGAEFVVAPTSNHNIAPRAAFEVFLVPVSGLADAKSLGVFPERGLGGATNASYIAPVVADVLTDKVVLYAMSPNNGICAYEMTVDLTPTAVKDERAAALEIYPNPAKDYVRVRSEVEIANIKVYSIAGSLVREVYNTAEVSVSGLRGSFIVHATDANGNGVKQVVLVK